MKTSCNHQPQTSVVAELARSLPTDAVSTINLVYFPQLGFLITVPVPPEEAGRVAERCAFELQFQSNRIAYYKNDRVRGNARDCDSPRLLRV